AALREFRFAAGSAQCRAEFDRRFSAAARVVPILRTGLVVTTAAWRNAIGPSAAVIPSITAEATPKTQIGKGVSGGTMRLDRHVERLFQEILRHGIGCGDVQFPI